MKTILYLHAGAEMYGADKILLELTTGLDKRKFKPIVVLPNDGILKEKLLNNGVQTYVVSYPILRRKYFNPKGVVSYLANYRRGSNNIVKLLNEKNIDIDIIHINTMAVLEGIYLKKKLGAKLVWHVHEIIKSPRLVAKFLNYCVGSYSNVIVAVSKSVKNNLTSSKYVSSSKVKVIYNGINSDKFSPNIDCQYLFDEWNVPQDSIRVGMIGRINKWKGQNDFLDAAVPLLNRYPNLYLFIVGGVFEGQEWRVDNLKQRIFKEKNRNRIILSDFRTDNNAVENFFNILVLPSTSPDPLPTVVLEAMGTGKAIVGYNHGGVAEMVLDGWNGLLATPNSTSDLRRKILDCISKRTYIKMGTNSRKRLVNYFSFNSFIKKFESLYSQI